MRSTPRSDRLFAFLSWLIVFGMLFAAVQVAMIDSTGQGPVAGLIGVTAMKTFYAAIYVGQGLLLAYSKYFQKKNLRKGVLMSIYLFMGFTTILSVVGPAGISLVFLDNALITVFAALCWLHWKFRTEYLDPQEFDAYIAQNQSTEQD